MGLRKSLEALSPASGDGIDLTGYFQKEDNPIEAWQSEVLLRNPDGSGADADFTIDIPSGYDEYRLIVYCNWGTSVNGNPIGLQFDGDTRSIYDTTLIDNNETITERNGISHFDLGTPNNDLAPSTEVKWNGSSNRSAFIVNSGSNNTSPHPASFGWTGSDRQPIEGTTARIFYTGTNNAFRFLKIELLVREEP